MTTDAELADDLARGLDGSDHISYMLRDTDWRKIIAALRRQSGEMVADAARWSWWREACKARPNDGGPTAVAEAAFCYQVLIEGNPSIDELADAAIKNYPRRAAEASKGDKE